MSLLEFSKESIDSLRLCARACPPGGTGQSGPSGCLGQRLATAKQRLVNTQKAYEQGARSTLEWLAAQSAVFDAEGQLYLERLAIARQLARRQAQAGQLLEAQLGQLDQYLR